MSLTGNHLVGLLLYIFVVNEIRLPLVTCQDEDGTQCMPKTAFLALLRQPEISSTWAAYSRSGRVTQDSKSRNEMAHLRALAEETDDTEICVPGRVYLQLLRDPAVRGELSAIFNGRTQKLPDSLRGRLLYDGDDMYSSDLQFGSQKRSIATLAKNDDLPISLQDRIADNEDDEEKRAAMSSGHTDMEAFSRDFPMDKRNVGTLARDFALPPGRRNIASLVRDYDQNKGNRERMVPFTGKRNVASLARTFTLPQSGKRNVASVAREYGLPYGKRSVIDEINTRNELLNLLELSNLAQGRGYDAENAGKQLNEFWSNVEVPRNGFGYGEVMQTIGGQYPNAEKRFMGTGSAPEMRPEVDQIGYPETFHASKRHIGALARLGWLSSLKAARFSRSPRYLADRENPADGSSSDYSSNSSTRSLRPNFNPRTRYVQALHGDCQHGFKRFLLLPTTDNYFHRKLPSSLRFRSL